MPGLFFCFLAREIIRAVRTKTFSAHVRGKITALVRKTGLSTHDRSTRPDMGPRSRGCIDQKHIGISETFCRDGLYVFKILYICDIQLF